MSKIPHTHNKTTNEVLNGCRVVQLFQGYFTVVNRHEFGHFGTSIGIDEAWSKYYAINTSHIDYEHDWNELIELISISNPDLKWKISKVAYDDGETGYEATIDDDGLILVGFSNTPEQALASVFKNYLLDHEKWADEYVEPEPKVIHQAFFFHYEKVATLGFATDRPDLARTQISKFNGAINKREITTLMNILAANGASVIVLDGYSTFVQADYMDKYDNW